MRWKLPTPRRTRATRNDPAQRHEARPRPEQGRRAVRAMETQSHAAYVKAPLRVTLFGNFALCVPDGTEITLTIKRARALLAILCLTPGMPVERERLCELLWRGRFRAQARASLRQTLLGLKKQLTPFRDDIFEVTRETVAVNPSAIRSDLAELEAELAGGSRASELLLAIGNKPLLDGFEFGDAFTRWRLACRAQVEQRLRVAVEQALADLQRRGDDYDDDCHDKRHDKRDNERAHARLLDAWSLRGPAVADGGADARTRIAVLPFQSLDDDGAPGPVAQGLFDELVTTLGQGSLQRQGELVRVHICLVDGNTGFERWSHGFRGASGNVFALQDDIAQA